MDPRLNSSIYECEASMFIENCKKWVYGTFYLSPTGLYFECNKDQASMVNFFGISIDYDEMTAVMKETSSYVFPSVTVLVGTTKYWFSSFPSRETVFVLIEHFQKERLLTYTRDHKSQIQPGSQLGHELLALAHDSAKTLNSTGRTLHRQGKQLDDALMTATDVKQELEVADTLISRLESWFSSPWSSRNAPKEPQVILKTKKRYKEIKIVFHKDTSTKSKFQPGLLRISEYDIVILNEKENFVFQFNKSDDGKIDILAPWELRITKRNIGHKDVIFNVTTAQLVLINPFLRKYFDTKIDYSEKLTGRRQVPSAQRQLGGQLFDKLLSSDQQVVMQQSTANIVTDQEAQELSQMISQMKSLAMDLGQEQEDQMDKIEAISSVVDNCDIQIKEEVKRMRRLM